MSRLFFLKRFVTGIISNARQSGFSGSQTGTQKLGKDGVYKRSKYKRLYFFCSGQVIYLMWINCRMWITLARRMDSCLDFFFLIPKFDFY